MARAFCRTGYIVFLVILTTSAVFAQQTSSKVSATKAVAAAPAGKELPPVTRRGNMNVNYNNGNFSVAFIDFAFFSDPIDLGLSRTYNSRSNYEGFFGYGWSSNIDTYLEFLPDGSLLLREGGGGKTDVLVSAEKVDFTERINELITQLKSQETARSETYWKNVRDQAINDEFYRRALFRKQFPSDVKYLKGNAWSLRSGQAGTLTRSAREGFKLSRPNSPDLFFDEKGNVIRLADTVSKAYLTFKWEKTHLKEIADTKGRTITFAAYTPEGQVKTVVFTGATKEKVTTTYEYSKQGEANRLMAAKDGYGNEFRYVYRADGNLTQIVYHDKTVDEVTYGKKQDWVERVKSWNGSYVDYNFSVDSANPLKQSVSVQLFNSNGKPVGPAKKSVYEFKRRAADGSLYLAELKELVGKSITETVFNECCQMPLKVVVNGVASTMTYDEQGRLMEKKDAAETVQFTYKDDHVQPASVTRNNVTFTYENGKAGVERARGPDGEVLITYDETGRIATLKNPKKGSVLKFTYTPYGQPEKIEQENFGAIHFKYNAYGELMEMAPTSFADEVSDIMVATKITGSFQDFLNLTLPTRVSTNPEMQLSLGVLTGQGTKVL